MNAEKVEIPSGLWEEIFGSSPIKVKNAIQTNVPGKKDTQTISDYMKNWLSRFDINDPCDEEKNSLLTFFAKNNCTNEVLAALKFSRVNPTHANQAGFQAFHYFGKHYNEILLKHFIENSLIKLNPEPDKINIYLDYFITYKFVKTIIFLLQHGLSLNTKIRNNTPAIIAIFEKFTPQEIEELCSVSSFSKKLTEVYKSMGVLIRELVKRGIAGDKVAVLVKEYQNEIDDLNDHLYAAADSHNVPIFKNLIAAKETINDCPALIATALRGVNIDGDTPNISVKEICEIIKKRIISEQVKFDLTNPSDIVGEAGLIYAISNQAYSLSSWLIKYSQKNQTKSLAEIHNPYQHKINKIPLRALFFSPLAWAIYTEQESLVKELLSRNDLLLSEDYIEETGFQFGKMPSAYKANIIDYYRVKEINNKAEAKAEFFISINPIYEACRIANQQLFELVVDHYFKHNQVSVHSQHTMLRVSALNGHYGNCIYLLDKGACPNFLIDGKKSLLSFMLERGETEVANRILAYPDVDMNLHGKYGSSPILTAVKKQRQGLTNRIMTKDNVDLTKVDKNGNTALHLAIMQNNTDSIPSLIAQNCDLFQDNHSGINCFTLAKSSNEILNLVLDNYRKIVDFKTSKELQKELISAVLEADYKLVDILITKGVNFNCVLKNGNSILTAIILAGETNLAKKILNQADATSFALVGHGGMLPLMALIKGSHSLFLYALNCKGINVNAVDSEGRSAIFYAATKNDTAKILHLISRGAKVNNFTNIENSPLYFAYKNNLLTLFDQLIIHNCIDYKTLEAMLDEYSYTNSSLIEKYITHLLENHTIPSPLLEKILVQAINFANKPLIRLITPYFANKNFSLTIENQTPVLYAASTGKPQIVNLLLKLGYLASGIFDYYTNEEKLNKEFVTRCFNKYPKLNIDVKSTELAKLVLYATRIKDEELLIKLVNFGAPINYQEKQTRATAIKIAVQNKLYRSVTLLLSLKVEFASEQLLCLAVENNDSDMQAILLENDVEDRGAAFARLVRLVKVQHKTNEVLNNHLANNTKITFQHTNKELAVTALKFAIDSLDRELIIMLDKRGISKDLTITDTMGPIAYAIAENKMPVLMLLVSLGFNVLGSLEQAYLKDKRDNLDTQYDFDEALYNAHSLALKLLSHEKYQLDKNEGKKVLIYACGRQISNLALALLAKNVNPNEIDNDGNTSLHLAIRSNKLEVFKQLLQKSNTKLNLPNNYGETPLMAAIKHKSIFMTTELARQVENIDFRATIDGKSALAYALDLYFDDHQPSTPIEINIIEILLYYGACPNQLFNQKQSLLMHCAQNDKVRPLLVLLENGAYYWQKVQDEDARGAAIKSGCHRALDAINAFIKYEWLKKILISLSFGVLALGVCLFLFGASPYNAAIAAGIATLVALPLQLSTLPFPKSNLARFIIATLALGAGIALVSLNFTGLLPAIGVGFFTSLGASLLTASIIEACVSAATSVAISSTSLYLIPKVTNIIKDKVLNPIFRKGKNLINSFGSLNKANPNNTKQKNIMKKYNKAKV